MKIDRKKFLDNAYIKNMEIEEALGDAEVDNFVEVRPIKMEKIKNIYIRRLLMIILLPIYIVFAWFTTLCWTPFLYIIKCVNIVAHLVKTMLDKWN